MNSVYSKLQNVNEVFLDCRIGPTLSCMVAEFFLFFSNSNLSTKITKPFNEVKTGEGEFKNVRWREEPATFEKEDVRKLKTGGKGRGRESKEICCCNRGAFQSIGPLGRCFL